MFLKVNIHRKVYLNWKGGLLFFFSVLTGHAFPQDYNFRNFSTEEGLAQSYVYSVIQDDRGYLSGLRAQALWIQRR